MKKKDIIKIIKNKRFIVSAIAIIVIIVCAFVIYYKLTVHVDYFSEEDLADTGVSYSSPNEPGVIKIDIEGAVKKPGLKVIKGNDPRLDDAIKQAKGMTRYADSSQINLAMRITDGMKIVVPYLGQELIIEGRAVGKSSEFVGKVNVNTATFEELQQIPGIGPSYAKRIIEYRNAFGPFRGPEDLLDIKGIGKKKLASMKENLDF